jgi:hypothetical protein
METGKLEANLAVLNEEFRLPFVADLIVRKTTGVERQILDSGELVFFESQFTAWEQKLRDAGERTSLPAEASARPALNELLVRLRLGLMDSSSNEGLGLGSKFRKKRT